MKYLLFNNWTLLRFIRLALGVVIIVQGVAAGHGMFIIAGVLFTGMALFNAGCCTQGSCQAGKKTSNTTNNTHKIEYEEVV